MILTSNMLSILQTVCKIERISTDSYVEEPANDLGNQLIEHYYTTTNLPARELITEFMTLAGNVWLRKLLLRDTGPIQSSAAPYASLEDYIGLLAANDADPIQELTG